MKLLYPAIFHEDSDGIWAEFPDLEGCQSYGDTVSETLGGAKEALEGYCITLLEEGRTLPKASDIKTIKPDSNAFVILVETELATRFAKQKSVNKTFTIPRVRELREDNKKSQKEVAEMLNMQLTTYGEYERQDRRVPADFIIQIAKLYNVSCDYVLGLTNEKNKNW